MKIVCVQLVPLSPNGQKRSIDTVLNETFPA